MQCPGAGIETVTDFFRERHQLVFDQAPDGVPGVDFIRRGKQEAFEVGRAGRRPIWTGYSIGELREASR